MGKGGGCVPSKKRKPIGVSNPDIPNPLLDSPPVLAETQTPVSLEANSAETLEPLKKTLRIFIVFYSMYGHVEILAKKVKEGVEAVDGVEGMLFRVPETLQPDVLDQMRVPQKPTGLPEIEAGELVKADGLLFGFPTRFGSMAAQMKTFFDSMDELWRYQKLAGVPAGFFVSTGTQGGGQETTAWTAVTQLAHHGMIYVPIGYTFGAGMFEMDSIRGGSPYGAGVFSGDGSRKPTETELALAKHQGMYMASIVKRLGGHCQD